MILCVKGGLRPAQGRASSLPVCEREKGRERIGSYILLFLLLDTGEDASSSSDYTRRPSPKDESAPFRPYIKGDQLEQKRAPFQMI